MFNPNVYPQTNFETWSIDTVKSFVENPNQIPALSYKLANLHVDPSLHSDFILKFLQSVYNPPDNNLNLSQQKLQELHQMRIKGRHLNQFGKEIPKNLDMSWDNNREPQMLGMTNRPFRTNPTNRMFNGGLPDTMDTFALNQNKNRPPFIFSTALPYNQKVLQPKRKMDINIIGSASLKKKIRTGRELIKNPSKSIKVIDLVDDDSESVQLSKRNKKDRKFPQNRSLAPTGIIKTRSLKAPIEILDSPDLSMSAGKNDTTEHRGLHHEEEKDGDRETTTNATNMTHMEELNDNEKEITNGQHKTDEMIDFFNFDIEELGIKILGEVFLCSKCQKQIPQKDVDKGLKETCSSCLKIKPSKPLANKKAVPIKEEIIKNEQEPHLNVDPTIDMKEEKFDILGPLYQSRAYYEQSSLTDILDPSLNKKHTPIGKKCQVKIVPLTIFDSSMKRRIRKLWKPDRLDPAIYEKFKNDVNDRNSVYLIDDEITEILVRHKYNVEKALNWCIKSNPDFQYYVKRSANRKRIITRNWEKILEHY